MYESFRTLDLVCLISIHSVPGTSERLKDGTSKGEVNKEDVLLIIKDS